MFKIPKFGKAVLQKPNIWKRQSLEFQCLVKPNFRISMFGKAKVQTCNDWKS